MNANLQRKSRPNHQRYIAILRRMTPQERLDKAIELTENSRYLFRLGLRKRHPELSDEVFQQLYVERLSKCHNRNY